MGNWKNDVRADLSSGRRIKLQFRRVGARPWIHERRNGPARGIRSRLLADDRYSGKQVSVEVQGRLHALISGGEYSAYQLVFGSNQVDLLGWDETDEDLLFAQDTSRSGQFVQQWTLRMMALEAALKGVANSRLRRLLA